MRRARCNGVLPSALLFVGILSQRHHSLSCLFQRLCAALRLARQAGKTRRRVGMPLAARPPCDGVCRGSRHRDSRQRALSGASDGNALGALRGACGAPCAVSRAPVRGRKGKAFRAGGGVRHRARGAVHRLFYPAGRRAHAALVRLYVGRRGRLFLYGIFLHAPADPLHGGERAPARGAARKRREKARTTAKTPLQTMDERKKMWYNYHIFFILEHFLWRRTIS